VRGGIAALEGLLRLRRLLGSSVDIDVVAPNDELVMRPLAVRQPFAFGPPSRYELGRILADSGANWLKDTLAWVDREAQVVHTGDGETLRYDALLIAVGGRQIDAFEHVRTFRDAESRRDVSGCGPGRRGGLLEERRFFTSRWAGLAAPAL
jgi:NADH dehydrogenase FAD-containing subunit